MLSMLTKSERLAPYRIMQFILKLSKQMANGAMAWILFILISMYFLFLFYLSLSNVHAMIKKNCFREIRTALFRNAVSHAAPDRTLPNAAMLKSTWQLKWFFGTWLRAKTPTNSWNHSHNFAEKFVNSAIRFFLFFVNEIHPHRMPILVDVSRPHLLLIFHSLISFMPSGCD